MENFSGLNIEENLNFSLIHYKFMITAHSMSPFFSFLCMALSKWLHMKFFSLGI